MTKAEETYLPGDYEFIFYNGDINYEGYSQLTAILNARPLKKKGVLVLNTLGGDPNAGYRISRACHHHFVDDFKVLIVGPCKSAGTLVVIGCSELIMSDEAELGPLDVQIAKKEELFERSSGLDIIQTIHTLRQQSIDAFKESFASMRFDMGLGTKIASKYAVELATGFVSPILAQIDPQRIGEHQRALRIANSYGERLNQKFNNSKPGTVSRLLLDYPAHNFVIDRKEARDIFHKVRAPNDVDSKAVGIMKHLILNSQRCIVDLETLSLHNANNSSDDNEANNITDIQGRTTNPDSTEHTHERIPEDGRSRTSQEAVRSVEERDGPNSGEAVDLNEANDA